MAISLWTLTVIKRYEPPIPNSVMDEMEEDKEGEWVKWEDVQEMLNNATCYKGYNPAEDVRCWNILNGELSICMGAEND